MKDFAKIYFSATPQCASELTLHSAQIMGATMDDGRKISVAASVMEIYNEKLIDLLAPSTGPGNTFGGGGTPSKASLKVQKGRVLGAQSVRGTPQSTLLSLVRVFPERGIVPEY